MKTNNESLGYIKRYDLEIREIDYLLTRLENNRVSELSGNNMEGTLEANAKQLSRMIKELLNKVDTQGPSENDHFKFMERLLKKKFY